MLGELKNPTRNKVNPYFGSKYADLASILEIVRPVCKKYNCGITFTVYEKGEEKWMKCRLIDNNGKTLLESECPLIYPETSNPQELGKAMTYAERYALCAMLGLAGEDDDDAQSIAQACDEHPMTKKQREYLSRLFIDLGVINKEDSKEENRKKINEYIKNFGYTDIEVISSSQASELIETLKSELRKTKEDKSQQIKSKRDELLEILTRERVVPPRNLDETDDEYNFKKNEAIRAFLLVKYDIDKTINELTEEELEKIIRSER